MEWAQATKKQLDMTLFYFVFCIAYYHVAGAFESRALFFIAKNDCGNSITRQNIGLWMLVMFTRWGQSTLTISREKKYSKQHSSVCIVCENTKSNRNETVANVAVCVFYIFFFIHLSNHRFISCFCQISRITCTLSIRPKKYPFVCGCSCSDTGQNSNGW